MDRRRYLVALAGAAMVGLAGCNTGGDGESTDGATPAADTTAPGMAGTDASMDGTDGATATPTPGDGPQTYTPGDMDDVTAAPGTDTPTATAAGTPTGTPPPADQVVEVGRGGTFFEPNAATVAAGDTVRWVWVTGGHNIAIDSKPAESDWSGTPGTGVFDAGYVHWHTFEVTGTYDYYCVPHRDNGMKGELVVE